MSNDLQVGHMFKELPVFAHKRAANLRDKLVKTDSYVHPQHFLLSLPNGNFPCRSCVQYNAMIKAGCFTHLHSGGKFPVKSRISCRTKFVVYLLKCPCSLCFVDKTKRDQVFCSTKFLQCWIRCLLSQSP